MLPPEVAARWAAPLGVLCEERGERLGIAVTQRLCGGANLIDHSRSMAQVDATAASPFVGLFKVEGGVADDDPRLVEQSENPPMLSVPCPGESLETAYLAEGLLGCEDPTGARHYIVLVISGDRRAFRLEAQVA